MSQLVWALNNEIVYAIGETKPAMSDIDLSSEHLAELLQRSKTEDGRARLLQARTISQLASRLEHLAQTDLFEGSTPAGTPSTATAQLLSILRILRNCCAAGPVAADAIVQHGAHTSALLAAVHISQHKLASTSEAAQQVLLVAAQLAANMSMASTAAAGSVWESWFPEQVQQLLMVGNSQVHAAVCLALLAGCKAGGRCCQQLCSSAATATWLLLLRPVMVDADAAAAESDHQQQQQQQQQGQGQLPPQSVLQQPAAAGHSQENLGLLLRWVVVQGAGLHQLLHTMLSVEAVHESAPSGATPAPAPAAAGPAAAPQTTPAAGQPVASPTQPTEHAGGCSTPVHSWTSAQVLLLHLLAHEVELAPAAPAGLVHTQQPAAAGGNGAGEGGSAAAAWVEQLMSCLRAAAATGEAGPCEACLQVLKALVKRSDAGRGLTGGHDAVLLLQQYGLIDLLLQLLGVLGPPVNPRRPSPQPAATTTGSQQRAGDHAQAPTGAAASAGSISAPAGPFGSSSGSSSSRGGQQQLPTAGKALYPGYRSDLVSVLGNCLCGRRAVQDAVLAAGGIELLLSCCQLDVQAPLAKEWALWAVRNLCEGHQEVQQYIADIKVQDTVESEELNRMGVQLQLDKTSGKLQVVKKQQGQEGNKQ